MLRRRPGTRADRNEPVEGFDFFTHRTRDRQNGFSVSELPVQKKSLSHSRSQKLMESHQKRKPPEKIVPTNQRNNIFVDSQTTDNKIFSQPLIEAESSIPDPSPSFKIQKYVETQPSLEIEENSVTRLDDITTKPDDMDHDESFQPNKMQERKEALQEIDAHIQEHMKNLLEDVSNMFITDSNFGAHSEVQTADEVQFPEIVPVENPEPSISSIVNETGNSYISTENTKIENIFKNSPNDSTFDDQIPMSNLHPNQFIPEFKLVDEGTSNDQPPHIIEVTTSDVHKIAQPYILFENMQESNPIPEKSSESSPSNIIPDTSDCNSQFNIYPLNYNENVSHQQIPFDSSYPSYDPLYHQFYSSQPYYTEYSSNQNSQYHSNILHPIYKETKNLDLMSVSLNPNLHFINLQTPEIIGKMSLDDDSCHVKQIIYPTEELHQETNPVVIESLISVLDEQDQHIILPPDNDNNNNNIFRQEEPLKSDNLIDEIGVDILDHNQHEETALNPSSSPDVLNVDQPEKEPEINFVNMEKKQTPSLVTDKQCESKSIISPKSTENLKTKVIDPHKSHFENKMVQTLSPDLDCESRKKMNPVSYRKNSGSPETNYMSSLRVNSESRKPISMTSSYNRDLQSLDTIHNADNPPSNDSTVSDMYNTWLAQYGQWMENYKIWCQSIQYNANSTQRTKFSPVCKSKLSYPNKHSTIIDDQLSSISNLHHFNFSDVIDRSKIYQDSSSSTWNRKTSAAEMDELRKEVENTVKDLSDRLTYPLLHTIRCHAKFDPLSRWLIVSSHQKTPLGHYHDTKSMKLIKVSFLHRQYYSHPEYSDYDFEQSNTLEISESHALCGLCESEFYQLADTIDNVVIPSIGNSKMLPIWMFFSILIRFSTENHLNQPNSIDVGGDILNLMYRRISTIFLTLPKFGNGLDLSQNGEKLQNIPMSSNLVRNDFDFPLSVDGQTYLSQKNVIDYFKGQNNWHVALAISMCFPKFVPETIDDYLDTLPFNSPLTSLMHFRLQRPIPILRNIDYHDEENSNGRLNYFRRSWRDHVGIVLALADTPIVDHLPNDINLSVDGLLSLSASILLYCSRRLGYNDCLLIQSQLCFLTSNRKLESLESSMTNYKGYLAFYPSLHLIGVDPWIYSCCHNSIDRSLFGYDTLSLDILCSLPLHVLLLTNLWHNIFHSSLYFRNFHVYQTELGDPDAVFYIHYIRFALALKYVEIGMARQAMELIQYISISVVKFPKNFKKRFIFLLQKVGYEIFYASDRCNHPIDGIVIPSWLSSLVENWKTWPNIRAIGSSNDHTMHHIPHEVNDSHHEPCSSKSSIPAPILQQINNITLTEFSAPPPTSMNNTINNRDIFYSYQTSVQPERNLRRLSNSHLPDPNLIVIQEAQSRQLINAENSADYPTYPVVSEMPMLHVPFQKTQYSTQRTSTLSESRENLVGSFEIPRNSDPSVFNSFEESSPPASFQNISQNHPPNNSLPYNNNNNDNHYFNVSSNLYSSQGEVTSSFLNQIYPDTSECIFSKFPSSINEGETNPSLSSESNGHNVNNAQSTPNSLTTSQSVTTKMDSASDQKRNASSQSSQDPRGSSSVLGSLFGLVKNIKFPKRKRGFDIVRDELVPNSEDTIAPKSDLSEDLKAPPLSPIDPSINNNDPMLSMSTTSLSSDLDAKSNSPGSFFPVSRRANRYIKPSY